MYPPHHLGGYELIWWDADRYLEEQGHTVRTLVSDYRNPASSANGAAPGTEDHDVHRELRWYWRDHRWPRISLGDRVRLERHNAEVLDRHLDEFRPDVVGWWSMGGMSLSLIERVRRRRIPAGGFICEAWLVYGPRVDGWMRATRWPVVGAVAAAATGIPTRVDLDAAARWLFMSEVLRRRSSEERGLSRTAVAYKGADAEVFRPAEPHGWRYRLLCAGRLDERKGIDIAIRALRLLPGVAELEVVGDGDGGYLDELRRIAHEEGVDGRVSFLPGESRERLRDRYAAADALLFPVTWQEPWGLVPLEAMAVGTPVIATGRGGSGEYLRDRENCLLFDPDAGPEALAAAVAELAEDDGLRRSVRENGAATTASMDQRDFSRAVEVVLRESLEEAR